MIQYGLISQVDARTLEKTIDLICSKFSDKFIKVTEIGLFNCETSYGIINYLLDNGRLFVYTGIDNEKDKKIEPTAAINLIIGNSNEAYNQLEDNSQHLILVDGDHSLIGVISDFYAYADKVKVGGYFCFHDTGKHIAQFKDFQHGDKNNPDAYISVRKALHKLHLLFDADILKMYQLNSNWELIFDEADINDEAGGICVFKKLY